MSNIEDKTINCKTAKEFVEILDPSHERWAKDSWSHDWIFRGQADSNWRLIPSALRTNSEGASKTIKIARQLGASRNLESDEYIFKNFLGTRTYENWREFVIQLYAEITNLREFFQLSDSLNLTSALPTGDEINKFGTHFLTKYFEGFREDTYQRELWGKPANAIAQHHGLATRLLDWTRNPLYAAYFATEGEPTSSTLAVYGLSEQKLRGSDFAFIEVSKAHSSYIHAQEGVFTLDMKADLNFLDTGIWRSFEEVFKDSIWKFTLPISEVPELVRILWLKRVTKAHMMPILDNTVEALALKWEYLLNNRQESGNE